MPGKPMIKRLIVGRRVNLDFVYEMWVCFFQVHESAVVRTAPVVNYLTANHLFDNELSAGLGGQRLLSFVSLAGFSPLECLTVHSLRLMITDPLMSLCFSCCLVAATRTPTSVAHEGLAFGLRLLQYGA